MADVVATHSVTLTILLANPLKCRTCQGDQGADHGVARVGSKKSSMGRSQETDLAFGRCSLRSLPARGQTAGGIAIIADNTAKFGLPVIV